MRIDIHIHDGDEKMDQILALLQDLIRKVDQMASDLQVQIDRLTADVTLIKSKADSLIALVQGLAQIIRDNAGNPAALSALADSLESEATSIQAAVDANTPAAPAGPAVTPPAV